MLGSELGICLNSLQGLLIGTGTGYVYTFSNILRHEECEQRA